MYSLLALHVTFCRFCHDPTVLTVWIIGLRSLFNQNQRCEDNVIFMFEHNQNFGRPWLFQSKQLQ